MIRNNLAEELRQLLRRIEEMPSGVPNATPARVAAVAGRRAAGDRRGVAQAQALALPLARPTGLTLPRHRKLVAVLGLAVIAMTALAVAHSSLLPWPSEPAGDTRPAVDTTVAAAPPPAAMDDAASAVVASPAVATPVAAVEPPAEVTPEQTTLPPDTLRRSFEPSTARPAKLMVPVIHAISGQRVRVPMRIEPGTMSTHALQVSVRGVPRGARFDRGTLVAPNRWVVPAKALGSLELALGDNTKPGRFELLSELRGTSGRPITRTRSSLIVTAPSGHGLASSVSSGDARAPSPAKRVSSVANCRPCRCFRASPIYWEYRGLAGWVARAGPAKTTCYVTSSIQ